MSEDEFLAAALNSAIPDYVRSYAPDLGKTQSSPEQASSDGVSTHSSTTSAFSDAFLLSLSSPWSFYHPLTIDLRLVTAMLAMAKLPHMWPQIPVRNCHA